MRALVWVSVVAILISSGSERAEAQENHAGDSGEHSADAVLDGSAPLVLHAEPELVRAAERVAIVLSRRMGVGVTVGDPPASELLEVVPAGSFALGRRDGKVAVLLVGRYGLVFAAELDLPNVENENGIRELALAMESLRDAALEAAAPPATESAAASERRLPDTGTRWRVLDHGQLREEGAPWGPRDSRPSLAKPTIFLRALLGYSPARAQPILGFGTGLGVCVAEQCVVFEADVPLVADVRSVSGINVRYRFFDFAARFQLRPWRWGNFTPAFGLGALMRLGSAEIPGNGGATGSTSELGIRATAEIAYRFHPLFEVVLEGGVDYHIDRSTFVTRDATPLVLEDRWTPWLITSVRLRP